MRDRNRGVLHGASRALVGTLVLVGGMAAGAASAAPAAADDGPLFPQPAGLPSAWDLVARDFDGDSIPDLVTVDGSLLGFHRGEGDGRFTTANELTLSQAGTRVLATDLDGDSRLDLAVLLGAGSVEVLLGDGTGTFSSDGVYAVGPDPVDMALGDVKGDASLDLVVTHELASVDVLEGLGDGTFAPAVVIGFGTNGNDVHVVDLDNDGFDDVAFASHTLSEVRILWNDGTGAFPIQTNLALTFPTRLAVGDLDGDLDDDLLARKSFGSLTAYENLGSRSFVEHPAVATLEHNTETLTSGQLRLVDMDGDGRLDSVATVRSEDELRVNLVTGSFVFGAPQVVDAPEAYKPVMTDVDGDGWLDVVVADLNADSKVVLGAGDGLVEGRARLDSQKQVIAFVAGEFTGDGDADLLFLDGIDDRVRLHPSDGAGGFANAVTVVPPDGGGTDRRGMAAGHLDADSALDLVLADWNNSRQEVWLGNGDGTFTKSHDIVIPVLDRPIRVQLHDMDGDDELDIVELTSKFPDQKIVVRRGLGDGTFAAGVGHVVTQFVTEYVVGDADGDLIPDVALGNDAGSVSLLLGVGDGTLSAEVLLPVASPADHVAIVDRDDDGIPDIVAATESPATLTTLHGTGGGAFAAGVEEALGGDIDGLLLRDFDGDGWLELVVARLDDDRIDVRRGAAGGAFEAAAAYPVDDAFALGTGDVDGDGAPDLLVAGYASTEDCWWDDFNQQWECSVNHVSDVSVFPSRALDRWTGLHQGLGGDDGAPRLTGEGSLEPGAPTAIMLRDAQPSAPLLLVIGVQRVDVPLHGGTLVPDFQPPGGLIHINFTDGDGRLVLAANWPATVPGGTEVFLQAWMEDGTAPFGYVASNAIKGTSPF